MIDWYILSTLTCKQLALTKMIVDIMIIGISRTVIFGSIVLTYVYYIYIHNLGSTYSHMDPYHVIHMKITLIFCLFMYRSLL